MSTKTFLPFRRFLHFFSVVAILLMAAVIIHIPMVESFSAQPAVPSSSSSSSSPFAPDPTTDALKQKLYNLCEGTRNGVDADEATRTKIGLVEIGRAHV